MIIKEHTANTYSITPTSLNGLAAALAAAAAENHEKRPGFA